VFFEPYSRGCVQRVIGDVHGHGETAATRRWLHQMEPGSLISAVDQDAAKFATFAGSPCGADLAPEILDLKPFGLIVRLDQQEITVKLSRK